MLAMTQLMWTQHINNSFIGVRKLCLTALTHHTRYCKDDSKKVVFGNRCPYITAVKKTIPVVKKRLSVYGR